LMAYM